MRKGDTTGGKPSFEEKSVLLEKRSAGFYRQVRERVRSENLKQVLDYLVEEEENHARALQELIAERDNIQLLNRAFARFHDTRLDEFEREREEEDIDEIARSFDSEADVLRFALEMEKKSIDLYMGVLEHMDDPKLSRRIRRVIDQERKHVRDLSDLLRWQESSDPEPFLSPGEIEDELRGAVERDEEKRDSGKGTGDE
jgi:rubrerythrin